MSKLELLSPAGGDLALQAAVETGADAVYLGGTGFNARQSAQNFTDEQLKDAFDYCHLHDVKVYVTLNTLQNDLEFKELEKYIRYISTEGADGVIVQDLGVASLVRKVAPNLPLHASTQMSVYDIHGALVLEKLGFKRVVLARELSKDQIKEICKKNKLEVEIFVHGAICVCNSGQCLMSSFIGGRSGNRGKCAQPCRLTYNMQGKTGYLLSPKDMCLINYLKEIEDIGVKSLKIEGRMKSSEYVGTVTSIYRKYIDSGRKVLDEDYIKLENIFYRGGFTDRYFIGQKGADMFCHTKPDNPYLKQTNYIHTPIKRTRLIDISCEISIGNPVKLIIEDKYKNKVCYQGEIVAEKAINKPISTERAFEQLKKLGNTVFEADNINVNVKDDAIIAISEINNARRNCIAQLEEKIISSFKREDTPPLPKTFEGKRKVNNFKLSVFVSDEQQLNAIRKTNCEIIYAPFDIASDNEIAILPRITPEDLEQTLRKHNIKRALARNIGQIKILNDLGIDIYIDFTLNVFNSSAVNEFEHLGAKQITVSTELMLAQIRDIPSKIPLEGVIYGYLPLMLTENCIIKSSGACTKGNVLADRMGEKFTVRCVEGCRNEILNSKPIVMSDKMGELKSTLDVGRLMFTTENPKQCLDIYNAYKNGVKIQGDFTRGKFFKGV